MKNLKLKDGSVIPFTDISTIYNLVGVYSTYAEIDSVRAHLTRHNLLVCEFDDVKYEALIPVDVSASSDMDGNITAIFTTREMTDIEKLQEHQSEADDAINFLLMNAE